MKQGSFSMDASLFHFTQKQPFRFKRRGDSEIEDKHLNKFAPEILQMTEY